MNQDELTQLLQKYTESLKANPAQAEILVRRGMVHHALGDLAAAIADCSAALALNPNFPEALNNRAVVRDAQGDYPGAMADFDQALRLRPAYPEAYNNRGITRQARGDLAGALADYDMAIRLQPGYAEAHNNRGTVRQIQRDLAGALADFDAALCLQPDYVEALDNRAGAHYLLWHHAQAVADYDRALALYRKQGKVDPALLCRLHVHRGDASYHDGNAAGLLTNYKQAFQYNPDLAARLIVERLADDVQVNFRLVLANCDKHLRENPDDFIAYARRALVWILIGQDDDAGRDIEQFHQKRRNPIGLLPPLLEQAKEYRQRHGPVIPGDTIGAAPPGAS